MSILLTSIGISYAATTEGLGSVIYEISPNQTTTSQDISLSNIGFTLVQRHLQIANIFTTLETNENSLTTIQSLELLAQRDIIQELNISNNKTQTIKGYLQEADKAISASAAMQEILKGQLIDLESNINACKIDKSRADQVYFASIDNYNEEESEQALTQSIAFDACASRNRIQHNAKAYIQSKLMYYTNIIQAKSKIIDQEQDNLILHFDVMSPSILDKLNNITQSLASYNL